MRYKTEIFSPGHICGWEAAANSFGLHKWSGAAGAKLTERAEQQNWYRTDGEFSARRRRCIHASSRRRRLVWRLTRYDAPARTPALLLAPPGVSASPESFIAASPRCESCRPLAYRTQWAGKRGSSTSGRDSFDQTPLLIEASAQ